MNIILTNPQANGHKDGETSGDVGISPYVGANIKINQMFSFDVSASFTLGDDYLAATFDSGVASDAVHPGVDAALALEGGPLFPEVDQDVLEEVGEVVGVATGVELA